MLAELGRADGRTKTPELAARVGTTTGYLTQVVAPLIERGWVRSEPGPTGGYAADGAPADVSVLDVVEAVEGPTDTGRCVLADRACADSGLCALHVPWTRACAAGLLAWRLRQSSRAAEAATAAAAAAPPPATEETPASSLAMDDVRIEMGFSLLPLINDVQGRRLTDQIKALRKTLAQEYGFVMPSVRILDNVQLAADAYAIRVREMDAGEGKLKMGALLAMDPTGAGVGLPGEAVKEPAFGLDAMWIDERAREEASFRGYTVVDPATVLATHLTEIIKEHMSELLTFAEVKKLIKDLPKDTQSLLDDVAPAHISWSGVQRIMQNLLKERVSIRDLATIVEAIAEAAPAMHDLVLITEHVRGRLARQICYQHRNPDGSLPIVTLSPAWEQAFAEALIGEGQSRQLALAPSKLHDFVADIRAAFEKAAQMGETPVLLTSPAIRPFVRSLIERFRPSTAVLSQAEVHAKVRLKAMGQV